MPRFLVQVQVGPLNFKMKRTMTKRAVAAGKPDAWAVALDVKKSLETAISSARRMVGREHFASEHANEAINGALRALKARNVQASESYRWNATDWECKIRGVKLYIRHSSEHSKLSVSLNPISWS